MGVGGRLAPPRPPLLLPPPAVVGATAPRRGSSDSLGASEAPFCAAAAASYSDVSRVMEATHGSGPTMHPPRPASNPVPRCLWLHSGPTAPSTTQERSGPSSRL